MLEYIFSTSPRVIAQCSLKPLPRPCPSPHYSLEHFWIPSHVTSAMMISLWFSVLNSEMTSFHKIVTCLIFPSVASSSSLIFPFISIPMSTAALLLLLPNYSSWKMSRSWSRRLKTCLLHLLIQFASNTGLQLFTKAVSFPSFGILTIDISLLE